MQIIGLTGGIASGKSTVSTIFREDYKLPVIDADLLSREAVLPGSPACARSRPPLDVRFSCPTAV